MVNEAAEQMSGVQRLPAMGQEFGGPMVFVRGQALQHILQIGRADSFKRARNFKKK